MKVIYEKEWFGIPFESFYVCDSKKLPGPHFYQRFYDVLFEKYKDWESLEYVWSYNKRETAKFILDRIPSKGNILSVGCGIGVIEKYLYESGVRGLEIQDISESSMRWIRGILPERNIHVGIFPQCLDSDKLFDYVFLSTVDYNFDQDDWVNTLRAVRCKLRGEGRCLVVSPNYERPGWHYWEIKNNFKVLIKKILSIFKLYQLGQFWGWRRSREEFEAAMTAAGFVNLEQGIQNLGSGNLEVYWIEGSWTAPCQPDN